MTVSYKLIGIPHGEQNFIQIGKTKYKSVFEDGHKALIKTLIKENKEEFKNFEFVFLFVAFDDVDNYRYTTIQLYPKRKRMSFDDIMDEIKAKFSSRIN